MTYFSDRELGKKAATVNEIDFAVWNGIVAIFDGLIAHNSFSKNFPEQCPDNKGISGCNTTLLYDKLKALIPNIEIPITRKDEYVKSYASWDKPAEEVKSTLDTFAILDFIEFCFLNLNDAITIGDFHEYFGHYHLSFTNTNESRQKFREEINSLFERNGIAYQLKEDGKIIRLLNPELAELVSVRYKTNDAKLNELLGYATSYFILPKTEDRFRATEKLWDAFERIKTYCDVDKKTSITQLLKLISNGNGLLETYLDNEAKQLTEIGNKFQIRHFEQGKEEINDDNHLDYLFHRLLSLINLMTTKLP